MFVACFSMNGRSSSHRIKKVSLLMRKFSFHSSGATFWEAKLSHQALVLPGLVQNLLLAGALGLANLALQICFERANILDNFRFLR